MKLERDKDKFLPAIIPIPEKQREELRGLIQDQAGLHRDNPLYAEGEGTNNTKDV